jgi:hypothetical protein
LVSLSLFNAVSVSSVSAVIKDLKKIPFSLFSLVVNSPFLHLCIMKSVSRTSLAFWLKNCLCFFKLVVPNQIDSLI